MMISYEDVLGKGGKRNSLQAFLIKVKEEIHSLLSKSEKLITRLKHQSRVCVHECVCLINWNMTKTQKMINLAYQACKCTFTKDTTFTVNLSLKENTIEMNIKDD